MRTCMSQQYRAMWPHVQQGMRSPPRATVVAVRSARATPHKSESITCPACQTVNQVIPDAVVAKYFGGMPHYFAQSGVIDKQARAREVQGRLGGLPRRRIRGRCATARDEPMERLKQREQMELDYWTAYAEARVKNEGGTARGREDARRRAHEAGVLRRDEHERRAGERHGMQGVGEQVTRARRTSRTSTSGGRSTRTRTRTRSRTTGSTSSS